MEFQIKFLLCWKCKTETGICMFDVFVFVFTYIRYKPFSGQKINWNGMRAERLTEKKKKYFRRRKDNIWRYVMIYTIYPCVHTIHVWTSSNPKRWNLFYYATYLSIILIHETIAIPHLELTDFYIKLFCIMNYLTNGLN